MTVPIFFAIIYVMLEFPKGFLWGAATSSHQVEGDNVFNDWWDSETQGKIKFASGSACHHYQLYLQDFDLARQLNHNAHRLSIEWSRIEPSEGNFSESQINHYIDVIDALLARNLEPVVTLHHFSLPIWFAKIGGWANKDAHKYFTRYTEKIVTALANKVKYWVTINEPMVYVYYAYIAGDWPPQEKSYFKSNRVVNSLVVSHVKAYRAIHEIYQKNGLAAPIVSIAHNMQAFAACSDTLRNKFGLYLRNKLFNFEFIERLLRQKALDFIGLNYYSRSLIDVKGWTWMSLLTETCNENHKPLKKNSMGWDIYPEGLYDLLLRLKKYKLPIFILENGICTVDDAQRWEYIRDHLYNLHLAISQGVKVLGYTYWSLLDNFEWDKGFAPRFGLIEVNYNTQARTIRESARKFACVCRDNRLDEHG